MNHSSSDEFEHDSDHEVLDLTDHHTSPRSKTKNNPPSAPQAITNALPLLPQDEADPEADPEQVQLAMQNLNGDLQALQDQRAEMEQMQQELETLRKHTSKMSAGDDMNPEEVRRATEAVNQISSSLGSFETKLENIAASPVRQRRVQEVNTPDDPNRMSSRETTSVTTTNESNDSNNNNNNNSSQLEQMRQLQEMQSALEMLEQNLNTVNVDGTGGSINDVAMLQEQMAMIQGVMGQLGEMNEYADGSLGTTGSSGNSEGNNDLGDLGGAMLSSLNRKMEALAGSPRATQIGSNVTIGHGHNGKNEEEHEEKNDENDGPTLDELMNMFKTHGLEMDRNELMMMLETEQGVQLVQQVLELSSLRAEQERQLEELKGEGEGEGEGEERSKNSGISSSSSNASVFNVSGASSTDTQHEHDKQNVRQLFLDRGYALSDDDLEQTLSSQRGKALAIKLRELNPTQLNDFSKSGGVAPIPSASNDNAQIIEDEIYNVEDSEDSSESSNDIETENVNNNGTDDELILLPPVSIPTITMTKNDQESVRELLSSRGIQLTDEQLVEVMSTERGKQMASQLRELQATRAQLQQAETSSARPSNLQTSDDRQFLRLFLEQQREGGVEISDEEIDAILATEQGKQLLSQLKELQSAEKEQKMLQATLQARIVEEEGDNSLLNSDPSSKITIEERDYLKALIRNQKGVDVSDNQLNELLATPMGASMVEQVRELLVAQENAAQAQLALEKSQSVDVGQQTYDSAKSSLGKKDREEVSELFFQQRGVRLSEEDLDMVMGSEMGQQLALQIREVKEQERLQSSRQKQVEEDEEEEDEALLNTSTSPSKDENANANANANENQGDASQRRIYVRALLAREGQGGALATVTDEELDTILSTERGRTLVSQLESASQQRAELEGLRAQAATAKKDMVDEDSNDAVTQQDSLMSSTTDNETERDRQREMVRTLLRSGEDTSLLVDDLSDIQLDEIINSERGRVLLRQLEEASSARRDLDAKRMELEQAEQEAQQQLELQQSQQQHLLQLQQTSAAVPGVSTSTSTTTTATTTLQDRTLLRMVLAQQGNTPTNIDDATLDALLQTDEGQQILSVIKQAVEATGGAGLASLPFPPEAPAEPVAEEFTSNPQTENDGFVPTENEVEAVRLMFQKQGFELPRDQLVELLGSPQGLGLLEELRAAPASGETIRAVLQQSPEQSLENNGNVTDGQKETVRAMFAARGIELTNAQLEQILSTEQGRTMVSELESSVPTTQSDPTPNPQERDAVRRAVYSVLSTILVDAFTNETMSEEEKADVQRQAESQAVVLSAALEEKLLMSAGSRETYLNKESLPHRLQKAIQDAGGFPGLLQGSLDTATAPPSPNRPLPTAPTAASSAPMSPSSPSTSRTPLVAPDATRAALREILRGRGMTFTDEEFDNISQTQTGKELMLGVQEMMSLQAQQNDTLDSGGKGAPKFVPPTIEEIHAYLKEREGFKTQFQDVTITQLKTVLSSPDGQNFYREVVSSMMRDKYGSLADAKAEWEREATGQEREEYDNDDEDEISTPEAEEKLVGMIVAVEKSMEQLMTLHSSTDSIEGKQKIKKTLQECNGMMLDLKSRLNDLKELKEEAGIASTTMIRAMAERMQEEEDRQQQQQRQQRPPLSPDLPQRPTTSRRVPRPSPDEMSDYTGSRRAPTLTEQGTYVVETAEIDEADNETTGSPRPKTSRKMRHPSPDDFMDYVSPSKRSQAGKTRPGLDSPEEEVGTVPSYQVQVQSFENGTQSKQSQLREEDEEEDENNSNGLLTPPPTPLLGNGRSSTEKRRSKAMVVTEGEEDVDSELSREIASTVAFLGEREFVLLLLRQLRMMPGLRSPSIQMQFLSSMHQEYQTLALEMNSTNDRTTTTTPSGFFVDRLMRNAEDSPNHGLSGRMQTPDKRTNSNGSPANTPTNQHHDYEEDIVGGVSNTSSVNTETNDERREREDGVMRRSHGTNSVGISSMNGEDGDGMERSSAFGTLHGWSDSSSAAGSDVEHLRIQRRYGSYGNESQGRGGDRSLSGSFDSSVSGGGGGGGYTTSEGGVVSDTSWGASDNERALEAAAHFDSILVQEGGTVHLERLHQMMAQTERLNSRAASDQQAETQQMQQQMQQQMRILAGNEMGSDSEDEAYDDKNDFLRSGAVQGRTRTATNKKNRINKTNRTKKQTTIVNDDESLASLRKVLNDSLTQHERTGKDNLDRRTLTKMASSVVRELRGSSSPVKRGKKKQSGPWSGPSSLSNGGRRTMLDPQLKLTLNEQLLRYEGKILTKDMKVILIQDVIDMIHEEMVFSEFIISIDESYRTDISEMRFKWTKKQRSYDAIPSVARRQSTWEKDRKDMEEEIVVLTEQRNIDLEKLHEERRRRLERSVRPLPSEDEMSVDTSMELTPLDNYLRQQQEQNDMDDDDDDEYLGGEEEDEDEEENENDRSRSYRVVSSPQQNTSSTRDGPSPRSLTRQSRKNNLERSPQAAAFAAGLDAARAAIVEHERPRRDQKRETSSSRTYNEAIRAAASANEISTQIEESLKKQRQKNVGASSKKKDGMSPVNSPLKSRSSNPQNQSYDEAIISLLQRAKVSGVDWSQMFEVTDRDGTGEIRARDFREAMVSILLK